MHTTRKRKKPSKYRRQQMLSDIENFDRMLCGNRFDREESEDSILARRPESASFNASDNEKNSHLYTRENKTGISADHGRTSTGMSSSAEFNRLSSEPNSRISREMDEMMNSVSVQIQRAINDAISNQVLPQIQSAFKARSGHVTRKGWDVPAERPEYVVEDCRNEKIRSNSKSELICNRLNDDHTDQAYDTRKYVNDQSLFQLLSSTNTTDQIFRKILEHSLSIIDFALILPNQHSELIVVFSGAR